MKQKGNKKKQIIYIFLLKKDIILKRYYFIKSDIIPLYIQEFVNMIQVSVTDKIPEKTKNTKFINSLNIIHNASDNPSQKDFINMEKKRSDLEFKKDNEYSLSISSKQDDQTNVEIKIQNTNDISNKLNYLKNKKYRIKK